MVWSEGTAPAAVYPNDINGAIADALNKLPGGYVVKTASINDLEQGVGQAALDEAAVLFWWGHKKHNEIPDATVARIVARIKDGMGFVALHSSHFAKPLKAALNASGAWKEYRNDGKPHRITVADPRHPLARGVQAFTISKEERYEEPFVVPAPDAVVLSGVHEANNNAARQLMTWTVGKGRFVYLRPGHEEFPVYFMPEMKRILRNCALFAAGDEAGIWEDNDPSARAARSAKEPPLALILREAGYGGTNVTARGEISAQRLVRAAPGPVIFTPLAAYGVLKTVSGGWYRSAPEQRTTLWKIDAPHNKQMNPPLMPGGQTRFDPGDKPFGLWVATEGFAGEVIYTEDALQKRIARFKTGLHKAHVYEAVQSNGVPVPGAVLIGFEYSTNDDNQEIVALVENVRPIV